MVQVTIAESRLFKLIFICLTSVFLYLYSPIHVTEHHSSLTFLFLQYWQLNFVMYGGKYTKIKYKHIKCFRKGWL